MCFPLDLGRPLTSPNLLALQVCRGRQHYGATGSIWGACGQHVGCLPCWLRDRQPCSKLRCTEHETAQKWAGCCLSSWCLFSHFCQCPQQPTANQGGVEYQHLKEDSVVEQAGNLSVCSYIRHDCHLQYGDDFLPFPPVYLTHLCAHCYDTNCRCGSITGFWTRQARNVFK